MTDILPSEAGAVNKTLRLRKDKEFCLVPLPDSAGRGAFLCFLDLASFRPSNSPGGSLRQDFASDFPGICRTVDGQFCQVHGMIGS